MKKSKLMSRIIGDMGVVTSCSNRRSGFTLAEVLITLGIIGVVAALTLPTLLTNVQGKIRAEQIRTVKYKFTKATDKMNSLGLIGPYESTSAFVAELQKHLKIAKVCPANNLRACWPYDTVTLADGKEWDITKTQTGKQFKMNSDENNDYTSPNVGIVTADGTPMILSYNKKCTPLDPVKEYGWSTEDNKPVSNATAGCVAAVFEINGTGKPNKQNQDVALFNANGLGSNCAIEIGNKCFTAPFSPTPVTKAECLEMVANGSGIRECYYNDDYWAGAVKQCGGKVSNLPTASDLAKIASAIYNGNPSMNTTGYNGVTYTQGTATSLGLPEPYFYLWSAEENNDAFAYYWRYEPSTSYWSDYGYRNSGGASTQAVCLTD